MVKAWHGLSRLAFNCSLSVCCAQRNQKAANVYHNVFVFFFSLMTWPFIVLQNSTVATLFLSKLSQLLGGLIFTIFIMIFVLNLILINEQLQKVKILLTFPEESDLALSKFFFIHLFLHICSQSWLTVDEFLKRKLFHFSEMKKKNFRI